MDDGGSTPPPTSWLSGCSSWDCVHLLLSKQQGEQQRAGRGRCVQGQEKKLGPAEVLEQLPVLGNVTGCTLGCSARGSPGGEGRGARGRADALLTLACSLEAAFHLPERAWSHGQATALLPRVGALGPLSQGPSDWTSADNLGNTCHLSTHSHCLLFSLC